MRSWTRRLHVLGEFAAERAKYEAAAEVGHAGNDNPRYPGGSICPSGSLDNAIHRDFDSTPACSQVCVYPKVLEEFMQAGGFVGGTCAEHDCTRPLESAWVDNVLLFVFACESHAEQTVRAMTRLSARCIDTPRAVGCAAERELVYQQYVDAVRESRADGPAGNATGSESDAMLARPTAMLDWVEIAVLATAGAALVVALGVLLCARALLRARPDLLRSPFPALVMGKEWAVLRNDVFQGVRVAQIVQPPPGLAAGTRIVVTTDGQVLAWDGSNRPAADGTPERGDSSAAAGRRSAKGSTAQKGGSFKPTTKGGAASGSGRGTKPKSARGRKPSVGSHDGSSARGASGCQDRGPAGSPGEGVDDELPRTTAAAAAAAHGESSAALGAREPMRPRDAPLPSPPSALRAPARRDPYPTLPGDYFGTVGYGASGAFSAPGSAPRGLTPRHYATYDPGQGNRSRHGMTS